MDSQLYRVRTSQSHALSISILKHNALRSAKCFRIYCSLNKYCASPHMRYCGEIKLLTLSLPMELTTQNRGNTSVSLICKTQVGVISDRRDVRSALWRQRRKGRGSRGWEEASWRRCPRRLGDAAAGWRDGKAEAMTSRQKPV